MNHWKLKANRLGYLTLQINQGINPKILQKKVVKGEKAWGGMVAQVPSGGGKSKKLTSEYPGVWQRVKRPEREGRNHPEVSLHLTFSLQTRQRSNEAESGPPRREHSKQLRSINRPRRSSKKGTRRGGPCEKSRRGSEERDFQLSRRTFLKKEKRPGQKNEKVSVGVAGFAKKKSWEGDVGVNEGASAVSCRGPSRQREPDHNF